MNRPMGMFNVEQRTSDGYFEANSLLQQWNKNNPERKMNRYISSSKTEEFINEIKLRESQGQKCTRQNYQPLIKIKGRNSKNGRIPDRVWMTPLLFIDFAMWINPSFKYDVLKFVYDKMIHFRNLSGDAYKTLATNVQKLVGSNFMPIAMRRIGEAINEKK